MKIYSILFPERVSYFPLSSRFFILFGIALCTSLIGLHAWSVASDGNTHLFFFDVGQGDGSLIRTPHGKIIVIDGGPDLRAIEHIHKHLSLFSRSIDLLILSHMNLDHYASFPRLLRSTTVKRIMMTGMSDDSVTASDFLHSLDRQSSEIIIASAGQRYIVDGISIDVLWPPRRVATTFARDLNNVSLVVRISNGVCSALFTGDSEERVERVLTQSSAPLKSTILKVGHHGSRTSSSDVFLQKVHPLLAIISVGKENSYGHPHPLILERLLRRVPLVLRTDQYGTIHQIWKQNETSCTL